MLGLEVAEERQPTMIIDDTLYREFRQRYRAAAELTIFYTQVKQYRDDRIIRALYPETTYYRYRHTLIRDGYLSLDDFRSKGGGQAYWP